VSRVYDHSTCSCYINRAFLNASTRLQPFVSLSNVSFVANCFRTTEVECVKKLALLHEFDDNTAVVATTVGSITTGIVQFRAK